MPRYLGVRSKYYIKELIRLLLVLEQLSYIGLIEEGSHPFP